MSFRCPHLKTLYAYPFSSICNTCPTHLILLNLITQIITGEDYKSWSSSLCNFLQSSDISSRFSPNIFLNTLFSNTLSLCLCPNKEQLSHPYKTRVRIIVL
jgi:hypothetical protein